MSRRPVGVILTGGESRRMGSDKAFTIVDGRPMVVAVADALWEGGCHPVECQGGDVERLADLGLPAIADTAPGAGPVAAIAQALARHDAPVVVAACDLARLDGASVRSLADAGGSHGGVAVAAAGGRVHLLSYWPAGAAEAIADLGDASYRDALAAAGAIEVAVDEAMMQNFNSPDDV